MITDKTAYRSRLRNISPVVKIMFSISSMIICVVADSITLSVVTTATMLTFIIFIGGADAKSVIKLMSVPAAFAVTGAAAIALDIGGDGSDMLTSLCVKGVYIGVSGEGVKEAVVVLTRCFGAVSCMYFLSFTTPMTDLFSVLRRSVIPNFLVEITELVYRYIFVLFDVAENIRTAQESRLGYADITSGYRSTGMLISNLFARAFRQAERTYTAMESRGYDGDINIITARYKKSAAFNVFAVLYIVLLAAGAIICRKAGI